MLPPPSYTLQFMTKIEDTQQSGNIVWSKGEDIKTDQLKIKCSAIHALATARNNCYWIITHLADQNLIRIISTCLPHRIYVLVWNAADVCIIMIIILRIRQFSRSHHHSCWRERFAMVMLHWFCNKNCLRAKLFCVYLFVETQLVHTLFYCISPFYCRIVIRILHMHDFTDGDGRKMENNWENNHNK